MPVIKKALKRDPLVPQGEPSPLHLDCGCGATVLVNPVFHVPCPDCGTVYESGGWIMSERGK